MVMIFASNNAGKINEIKEILCDYSEYKGSFLQICNSFLSKVQPETSASFIYKDE